MVGRNAHGAVSDRGNVGVANLASTSVVGHDGDNERYQVREIGAMSRRSLLSGVYIPHRCPRMPQECVTQCSDWEKTSAVMRGKAQNWRVPI